MPSSQRRRSGGCSYPSRLDPVNKYLGNTWTKAKTPKKKARKSQASEIVFIERVWELLKSGTGRVVIILPDGILTNARTRYVRDFILERFDVQAVVSLPTTAFSHYGASVKASIVMMRKLGGSETPSKSKPVFLAEAESVGYDATGRTTSNDLPAIAEAYREFCDNPGVFMVDLPELLMEAPALADGDEADEGE